MIGQSPELQAVAARIQAIAPADISVLIEGESGTGKELTARAIHELSPRRGRKFVALDCGALPETLLESELFGYVKGAFTGASADKTGLFETADGGTVFLDEISSASQAVQSRLMRVIEAGEIRRLGDTATRHVDVRLICATNLDLEIEINEQRFRPDLYYRLKEVKIILPPLRERKKDILLMAEFFKQKYLLQFGKKGLKFAAAARQAMENYAWPGNIRELEHTVKKAILLTEGKIIGLKELEIPVGDETAPGLGKQWRDAQKKKELEDALKAAHNNISKTASYLGISRRQIYRQLEKYGLKTQ